MTRLLLRLVALALVIAVLSLSAPASATAGRQAKDPDLPDIPIPTIPIPTIPELPVPGLEDCKQAPTPDMPGTGMGGFFAGAPDKLPVDEDPFEAGSNTTIYEQYGYAGLRWSTYDLGCGPDMMRQPDAVIGTSMSNWMMQAPIALTALTGSLTKVAFDPGFLGVLDPSMERVSAVLHDNLFASWAPGIIALLGMIIILASRRQALSTTAGAVGWAVLVVLIATALFRWPVEAGQAADGTVTDNPRNRGKQAQRPRRRPRPRHGSRVERRRGDPLPRLAGRELREPRQRDCQDVRRRPLQDAGTHLARGRPRPPRPRAGQEADRAEAGGVRRGRRGDQERRSGRLRIPDRPALGNPSRVRGTRRARDLPGTALPARVRAADVGLLPDRAARRDDVPRLRRPRPPSRNPRHRDRASAAPSAPLSSTRSSSGSAPS